MIVKNLKTKEPVPIPLETAQGAMVDTETIEILARNGACPIYSFWAFQQQYGIGWDFAEQSKNIGQ